MENGSGGGKAHMSLYSAQPVVALQEGDSGMPDISVFQLTWKSDFFVLCENS